MIRSRAAQVITGPMSMPRRVARAGRRCAARAPRGCSTSGSADVADGDHRRDRHAALAGRAVARADDRVGRRSRGPRRAARPRGSWRRRAPARACRGARRSRRCSFAIGVEPTNDTARTRGCASSASTASLSPWTTLNTPSGRPASFSSSAMRSDERRVVLGRLQDERVAAGDRDREHPHRHHRREVERRDAGAHADRLADRPGVDVGADVLAVLALEQMRNAAVANSTTSMPRVIEPSASASVLPCSCVTIFARSFLCLSISSRKRISTRARRSGGDAEPRRERRVGRSHRGVDVGGVRERHVADHLARRRIGHLAVARRGRGVRASADPHRQALERGQVHRLLQAEARCAPRSFGGVGVARHVARDQVDLEVDPRAGGESPQRRDGQCMRDQVHVKARALDRVDREAHAVDGDRALGRDVGGERARARRSRARSFRASVPAPRTTKAATTPTPSTCPVIR